VDLVRLAHYPFLPEVREAVREAGPGLAELLASPLYSGSRARALERLEGALGAGIAPPRVGSEREALLELLSVPVARMVVADLGEKPLLQRYAAAEARLARDHVARDPDPEALPRAASALGIAAEPGNGGWAMHFSEYIRLAPLQEPEWKLIRRPVAAGTVTLAADEMARLVQEALARRIVQELEAEKSRPLPPEVAAALEPLEARLEPRLEEARKEWTSGDFGPVQPGLFPPCVKEIFGELSQGRNVPHHGRFAFATFLHTIGWNAEQIMDYLSATPNFDREKSRYQIEHVTGQKGVESYMVPNCSTMQTNGVCPLDKRDGVCARIKNPLGYYRVRLKLQRREEAAKAPPPAGPQPQVAQVPQKGASP
jgi:DNA primase large subunit